MTLLPELAHHVVDPLGLIETLRLEEITVTST